MGLPLLGFPGAAINVVRIVLADLGKTGCTDEQPLLRGINLRSIQYRSFLITLRTKFGLANTHYALCHN